MGDIWNPFDTNNPVYVEVAKQTRASRRRVRATMMAGVVILIYTGGLLTSQFFLRK